MNLNIYSFDEIKARGDCLRYMREVMGQQSVGTADKEWVEFNSPFRPGSDSHAFKVSKVGFHDFVTEETGSIIDLAMRFRGCDMFEAASELGEWIGLQPKHKVEPPKTLVAVHQYKDDAGNVVHEALRYAYADGSKQIRQRRPDPARPGEYINNLDGIKPVLYRRDSWKDSPTVIVVEGEKKADLLAEAGLPVTTNAMGAGKWLDHYTPQFAGKRVVLIPDNDDPGEAHMIGVARAVQPVAKDIRIVRLAGLQPKEDVYEWIKDYGHTFDELREVIKATTPITAEQLGATAMPDAKQVTEAKLANERAFSNYEYRENEEGKKYAAPIQINRLLADLFKRFWGFPRRVGTRLFDHDRKSGEIRWIDNSTDLFAWIAEKSGHQVRWNRRAEGCASYDQFYSSVFNNARKYDAISGVPSWPMRDSVYYTFGSMPPATEDRRYFNQFVSFFSFATDQDRDMFKVMCASALYYREKVDRPLWVIDATDGQGSGKTKAAEYLAYLLGGEDRETCDPMWLNPDDLKNSQTAATIQKRMLSADGRKKRIVIIDNVVGHFRSSLLSTLVTQGSLSGMAPYGHGEETRPNDLTLIITVNSASLDTDGADRCFMIFVKKPVAPPPDWSMQVLTFIRENRMKVIADIMAMLDVGCRSLEAKFRTRFKCWESEVMAAILDDDAMDAVWKMNEERKSESNTDMDEAKDIENFFSEKIDAIYPVTNASNLNVFIANRVVSKWANEAIHGFGGDSGRNAPSRIKNMVKAGHSLKFGTSRGKAYGVRGLMWIGNPDTAHKRPVGLIDLSCEGSVKAKSFMDDEAHAEDSCDDIGI